jgi:hypothetical protein
MLPFKVRLSQLSFFDMKRLNNKNLFGFQQFAEYMLGPASFLIPISVALSSFGSVLSGAISASRYFAQIHKPFAVFD